MSWVCPELRCSRSIEGPVPDIKMMLIPTLLPVALTFVLGILAGLTPAIIGQTNLRKCLLFGPKPCGVRGQTYSANPKTAANRTSGPNDHRTETLVSMNWFQGKSTGNPGFHPQNYGLPVDAPWNQFRDGTACHRRNPAKPLLCPEDIIVLELVWLWPLDAIGCHWSSSLQSAPEILQCQVSWLCPPPIHHHKS